ncbi:MAG: glycosyltransferase [Cyclobacteriaceae bacterium]
MITILLWVAVFLITHTYILYPFYLLYVRKNNTSLPVIDPSVNYSPTVSIILACYNEDKILHKKLLSLLNTNYPKDKLEILIGSDASTDNTNKVIQSFAEKHNIISPYYFKKREGKTGVINKLVGKSTGDILLFTDSNILFRRSTIQNLTNPFSKPSIGLVAGNIINYNLKKDGISLQEEKYTSLENKIKYKEGIIWGTMIGAFGGIYAIREELFPYPPNNVIVDDFYVSMSVLEQGQDAILTLDALVHEDVSNKSFEEFKRKKRIATGNFQNLIRFRKLLISKRKGLAFSFWSHKVLRWLGPLFLITILLSNLYLVKNNNFYFFLLIGQLFLYSLALIELAFRKLNIHFFGLRFITHFLVMNGALFIGLWNFVFQKKNNGIWEPTKRLQ